MPLKALFAFVRRLGSVTRQTCAWLCRPMERSECGALDDYLAVHGLGPSNVLDAYMVHRRAGGDGTLNPRRNVSNINLANTKRPMLTPFTSTFARQNHLTCRNATTGMLQRGRHFSGARQPRCSKPSSAWPPGSRRPADQRRPSGGGAAPALFMAAGPVEPLQHRPCLATWG